MPRTIICTSLTSFFSVFIDGVGIVRMCFFFFLLFSLSERRVNYILVWKVKFALDTIFGTDYSSVGETLDTLVSGFVKTFNLDGKYNL